MLLVLRAATTCPTSDALAAWATFMETLSDGVLVALLPQMAVSMLAMIDDPRSHRLARYLFAERIANLSCREDR